MKKYKHILIYLIILFCLAITFHQVTYTLDKNAINNGDKPKFIIKSVSYKDGGTTIYYGLGYQIISWHKLEDREENNLDKQGFLVGTEVHRFPQYNNLEKCGQPQCDLKFIEYNE